MLLDQKTSTNVDKALAQKARIAIVRTDYYTDMIDNLEKYCIDTLLENGVKKKNISVFTAPGSWELPLIAKAVAKSKKFDAIVAFGIILKGETWHFDMIANECGRALMQISIDHTIPVALEVLAVTDIAQAKARAGKNSKNKGIEGATAVLKSLATLKNIG